MNMTSLHKTILLLKPSLLSGTITGLLTVTVISIVAWSYISSQGLFYELLFGRLGVATILLSVPNNVFVLKHTILDSSATYYFIVVVAATMVGVLVYALLQGVGRVNQEAKIVASELRTHDRRLKATVYYDLTRLGVRLAGLAGWLIYTLIFANILWPFVVSLMQVGLININGKTAGGWLNIAAAIVLLGVSLHLHVTFVRLISLRIRLFGGFLEEAEDGSSLQPRYTRNP